MKDTWPPPDGKGWPDFDEAGKRILERAFGPEDEQMTRALYSGVQEIKRLLGPDPDLIRPTDLEFAELGGEA